MKKNLLFFCVLAISIQLVQAQTRSVTGKVTEKATGSSLPGVAVTIKGTKNVVSTDVNGVYKIPVPSTGNVILVFNSIGYNKLEITVGAKSQVDAVLEENVTMLNEVKVVNIGYETIKRESITGAVSSVNAATIAAAPVSSVLEAIQGRVAGVSIASTEGSPEAEMTVRVRGGGSITQDNSPLYIVDGFPANTIADIAPNDIESIDVLKDASSTAIYGSRGANGVIIITTKSGKKGKTNISLNAFTGTRNLANKLNVLEPYDYVLWQYESSLLKNAPTRYTDYFGYWQDIDLYKNIPYNDWQEIIFGRIGTTYNQNLSIRGGSDKTKYSISHNYVKDKAIMLFSGYERHNLNFKLNHELYKRLILDVGVRFSNTRIEGGGTNEITEKSSTDSRLKYAMIYPSIPVPGLTQVYDIEDDDVDDNFALYNPILSLSDNDQLINRRTYNFSGGLTYQINNNLKLQSEIGYDNYTNFNDRFYGSTTYYVRNIDSYIGQPLLTTTNTFRNTLRNANTLNYDFKKILPRKHSLSLLVGHEYILTKENYSSYEIRGFPRSFSFDQTRRLTGQGVPSVTNNFYRPNDKILSFFTRANYNYKGKYLLSAAIRADGSSKFSEGNRWGYFPSVSAGWRISDEAFMKSTKKWLNDLKLRASLGAAGNNRIPSGQINQEYEVSNNSVYVNEATSFWSPSRTMANPDLRWETTITRNIGLDVSLFKRKLNITTEAYSNTTKDLLVLFPIPGTGYTNQYRNLGDTENKGLEFSVNYNAINKKNFNLQINANMSLNRSKIKSLGGLAEIDGDIVTTGWASTAIPQDYKAIVGGTVGSMFGYVSDGRYEVSDFDGFIGGKWVLKPGVPDASAIVGTIRPGSMKLKDLSGDLKITSDNDRAIIGNATPLHTGGFSINSRIYSFDLGVYLNWSYGNDIYNANKIEYTQTSRYHSRNMISEMASGKRWTNLRSDGTLSNDPAELAAMNANTTMWSPYVNGFVFSDWAVEDGSFLRLATVTVGYTLPKKLTSKVKIEKLRLYASGYNLHTWTNYSGFDPEVSTKRKSPLTPGVDYSAYPRSRSFVFGLNVNF